MYQYHRDKLLGRKMVLIVCMIIEKLVLVFESTFSITFWALTSCLAFSRARFSDDKRGFFGAGR